MFRITYIAAFNRNILKNTKTTNTFKGFATKNEYLRDNRMEFEINNELKVSSKKYNFEYPIPNQGSLNIGLSSLIKYRPKPFFPKTNNFNDEDKTDIWLSCDGFLLITSVKSGDVLNLYENWEQYNFKERVGPPEYTDYGTLDTISDDR